MIIVSADTAVVADPAGNCCNNNTQPGSLPVLTNVLTTYVYFRNLVSEKCTSSDFFNIQLEEPSALALESENGPCLPLPLYIRVGAQSALCTCCRQNARVSRTTNEYQVSTRTRVREYACLIPRQPYCCLLYLYRVYTTYPVVTYQCS